MTFSKVLLACVFTAQLCTAATECGKKGGKYNFSPLMAFELDSKTKDYTYTLRTCGTSSQECPDDPDGVLKGMAAQTSKDRCYILGVDDSGVEWTEDTGKQTATMTALGSGADCPMGEPRKLNLVFSCDESQMKGDLKDTKFTVQNTGCDYTYEVATCLACNKGCASGGFGSVFLIIFCVVMGAYLLIFMAWNAFKLEKKGLEVLPHRGFWMKFFALVKEGFGMTFLLITCKHRQASYDDVKGQGSASTFDSAYPTAESAGTPYQGGEGEL